MIYKTIHRILKIEQREPHNNQGWGGCGVGRVDELMCSGRVSSSCSTTVTCCVTLVTIPMTSHEWGRDND